MCSVKPKRNYRVCQIDEFIPSSSINACKAIFSTGSIECNSAIISHTASLNKFVNKQNWYLEHTFRLMVEDEESESVS